MEDIKKEYRELKNNFYMETSHLLDVHLRDAIWSWIEQKIKGVITEYKSKLVEGQSSGEWQSVLLVNALRLLNDKERNELALSIIERTTPNLLDEAKEEGFQAGCDFTCKQYKEGK